MAGISRKAHGLTRILILVGVAGVLVSLSSLFRLDRKESQYAFSISHKVELQPLSANARRVEAALSKVGFPLPAEDRRALKVALASTNEDSVEAIQKVLDRLCLFGVTINSESRVKTVQGPAVASLVQNGWRAFLVKVQNDAGVTAELVASSANALPVPESTADEVPDRWLDLALLNGKPMETVLSGLEIEYRVILLSSRDAGRREARVSFNVGSTSKDLGERSGVSVLFRCEPASRVKLRVLDENDQPTTASFIVSDSKQRIYPAQERRLAPDFAFQPQVYRADGEEMRLPEGDYNVEYSRGPESITQKRTITVSGKSQVEEFKIKRWIDPSKSGWWSGDSHIHSAGCSHYSKPTEGVGPADMLRHCIGEDLKVGCALTWGACFDHQKQYFCGKVDAVSKYPYLLRYDIEISGFGCDDSGHLGLLRLRDQMYPGCDSTKGWPTLGLTTLRWAKKQGAICGAVHSGIGLDVSSTSLPNYEIPAFNGIGACEYVVDVTHEVEGPSGAMVPAVDFMGVVDSPMIWELNMWYHTLNAGFRTRISGETDFPCMTDKCIGHGRSYVKLDGKLDFDPWCEGIQKGRSYVSDGKSHLMDFNVNGTGVGEQGSEVRLAQPDSVRVTANVAAMLAEQPDATFKNLHTFDSPYWHIERARIGESRQVPVELVVNGIPVATTNIVADGTMTNVAFDAKISRSSWVALRVLWSSHTNPIFVLVGDKPIRASRRSIDWCLKGVQACWDQKSKFIALLEYKDAVAAYEHARQTYQFRLGECDID